jgi:hypothetical protein
MYTCIYTYPTSFPIYINIRLYSLSLAPSIAAQGKSHFFSVDLELVYIIFILPIYTYVCTLSPSLFTCICSLSSVPSLTAQGKRHFFSIDQELIYWNFYLDFGPLNLGMYSFIYKYPYM